jgi:hypothetical protein
MLGWSSHLLFLLLKNKGWLHSAPESLLVCKCSVGSAAWMRRPSVLGASAAMTYCWKFGYTHKGTALGTIAASVRRHPALPLVAECPELFLRYQAQIANFLPPMVSKKTNLLNSSGETVARRSDCIGSVGIFIWSKLV